MSDAGDAVGNAPTASPTVTAAIVNPRPFTCLRCATRPCDSDTAECTHRALIGSPPLDLMQIPCSDLAPQFNAATPKLSIFVLSISRFCLPVDLCCEPSVWSVAVRGKRL